MSIAQLLLIAGAGIMGLLGSAHLIFTFFSDKFSARDPRVDAAMQQTSPRISSDTTMWKAWIGFNASHSLGPMIFAAFYIPLAIRNFDLIQSSAWLTMLPVLVGVVFLILAKLYWFVVPFTGILLATVCFIGSALLSWL